MNKIVKLKRVFLENNCFQSHESSQLSTNIQYLLIYLSMNVNETVLLYRKKIITVFLYD